MNDTSKPSRSTLGVKAKANPAPKDPGRKAVRPAGRSQAAGFKPKGEAPKRPESRDGDKRERNFSDRPRRDFGDRPPRQDGDRREGSFSGRPKRDFGGRPPRNFDDNPPRSFGDRPQGDRPQRSFEDRPRRDFGDRPRRDFNDKPRNFEDRPRRDFGDRPPRNFEDRPRPSIRPENAGEIKTDFPAANTTALQLFLPCPAGVQDYLAEEVVRITGGGAHHLRTSRGGVALQGDWATVQRLNLHSRLAQRVLIELAHAPYRQEADLYETALAIPWEQWFSVYQSFKIDITAQASPLQSLNFAALKIKDAVADRFRQHTGARPNVETHDPDVRIQAHLTRDTLTLYIDSSGQPLFKRGWRQDKGDAPLKETLAAAILAASGWTPEQPLYDPCCGSGTIAIEAAQIAASIAPGSQRSFGFERLKPFVRADWLAIKEEAAQAALTAKNAKNHQKITIFGSDVAHRMVDFAQRNAERAGVADWVEFRGGDALQRKAPAAEPGLIVLNPPYGERIATGGFAASDLDFFVQLAAHWKTHFGGWTAWVLSPDFKLPGHMHLAENRKVPMWNGPIECRLFRFEVQTSTPQPRSNLLPKSRF